MSGDMAARPFSTRDSATRDTPNCWAACVTLSPNAGSTSSRSVRPGWGGLNMRVMVLLLVVIHVINQHSVCAIKSESHSPVSIDRHGPMALQIIRQRVQAPSRRIHILIACSPVSYTHLRAHETVLDLVCR